ncbi:MAG: C_GCAxxG_C_C family protein [Papillibacter sp.]|nr:C_GCAxxG_C_C family protein [Papillibacter sp.]
MDSYEKRIFDLGLKGYCCSQILVQLGLDALNRENEDLINAVSGLCMGIFSGKQCGVLTGGACLLALFDKSEAAKTMIPRLAEWFDMTYTPQYGGTCCSDIVANDPMKKFERCPVIIKQTFEMCRELLEESGYDI